MATTGASSDCVQRRSCDATGGGDQPWCRHRLDWRDGSRSAAVRRWRRLLGGQPDRRRLGCLASQSRGLAATRSTPGWSTTRRNRPRRPCRRRPRRERSSRRRPTGVASYGRAVLRRRRKDPPPIAAMPPTRTGRASSIGKPPALGGVVADVVVVVEPGTMGVGVRKRNGVGVGTWATTCWSGVGVWTGRQRDCHLSRQRHVSNSTAPTAQPPGVTLLMRMCPSLLLGAAVRTATHVVPFYRPPRRRHCIDELSRLGTGAELIESRVGALRWIDCAGKAIHGTCLRRTPIVSYADPARRADRRRCS